MDEKQLQLLFNEYGKSKGFNDYNEFKSLMESDENRKLFFDESNAELGFKDYNEFNQLLGIPEKKKSGASFGAFGDLLFRAVSVGAQIKAEIPKADFSNLEKTLDNTAQIRNTIDLARQGKTPDKEIQRQQAGAAFGTQPFNGLLVGGDERIEAQQLLRESESKLSSNEQMLESERQKLQPAFDYVTKKVSEDYEQFMTKDGVIDTEKVLNYADTYAKTLGGGQNVKEIIAQQIAASAQEAKRRPAVLAKLNDKVQQRTGKTIDQLVKEKGDAALQDLQQDYDAARNEAIEDEGLAQESLANALGNMPFGNSIKAGYGFLSGLNQSIASKGAGLAASGINNGFTDWLRGFQSDAEKFSVKDKELTLKNILTDPTGTIAPRVAKQTGTMLPIIATAAIARNPYLAASIGFGDETLGLMGDTYNQVLAETGDPAKAREESLIMLKKQGDMAPTYLIEGSAILSTLKGGKGFAKNLLLENVNNAGQEVMQSFFQQQATKDAKSFGQFLEEDAGEVVAESVVATTGMMGGLGGIGAAYNVIAQKTPNAINQQLLNIIRKDGIESALKYVNKLRETNAVSTEEFDQLVSKAKSIEANANQMQAVGIDENDQLAAIANEDEIAVLQQQLAEAQSPVVAAKLQQQIAEKQQEAAQIAAGEGSYAVVEVNGGSRFVVPQQEVAATIADLKQQVADGVATIELFGQAKTENEKELSKIKVAPPETKPRRALRATPNILEEAPPKKAKQSPIAEPEAPVQLIEGRETGEAAPVTVELSAETPQQKDDSGVGKDVKMEQHISKLNKMLVDNKAGKVSYNERDIGDINIGAEDAVDIKSKTYKQLAIDIKENGVVPILVDKETGFVIDGTHRSLILKKMGIKNIPVLELDGDFFPSTANGDNARMDFLSEYSDNTPLVKVEQPILTKSPAPKSVELSTKAATPTKEGFTEAKDLNKMFADLKSKYGDKKGGALYDVANRLVDPNKNTIVQIRSNGVVVKEGDKYTLRPFGNTDANSKKWTLYKGIDVTDQFVKSEAAAPTISKTETVEPAKQDDNLIFEARIGRGKTGEAKSGADRIILKDATLNDNSYRRLQRQVRESYKDLGELSDSDLRSIIQSIYKKVVDGFNSGSAIVDVELNDGRTMTFHQPKVNPKAFKAAPAAPKVKEAVKEEPAADALRDVESTAKALETIGKQQQKRFYPDDKVVFTDQYGNEYNASFRGYNGDNKAVIFGERGSGLNQVEVDVSQIRPKSKSDKLTDKERNELTSKISLDKTPYFGKGLSKVSDEELQELAVRFPNVNKISGREQKEVEQFNIAITPLKKWQYQEYGVDDPNDPINIRLSKEHEEAINNTIVNDKYATLVSEAYHAAKKDGSNPELVAAVESLLGKQKSPAAAPITPVTQTKEPKQGDRVTVVSKTDKRGIEYFYNDGAWRFLDSRGKEQKATAKEAAAVTDEWRKAQGEVMRDVADLTGVVKNAKAKNIFENNSQLNSIGSIDDYIEYVNNIFPDSVVSGPVFHGTNKVFDKFSLKQARIRGRSRIGFWFADNEKSAKSYGKNVITVLLNIKSPEKLKSFDELVKEIEKPVGVGLKIIDLKGKAEAKYRDRLFSENKDGVVFSDNIDRAGQMTVYVALSEEQTHILGSKEDIDGFSEFIKNKGQAPQRVEIRDAAPVQTESGEVDAMQYVREARTVLNALFPDVRFEVYDTQEQYEKATGDTIGRGAYFPNQKRVVLNLEGIRRTDSPKTAIHEVIHPIVQEVGKSDEYTIANLWSEIVELGDIKGMDKVMTHVLNYSAAEQANEGVTEFLTRVVDGSIDPKAIPKSIVDKVIDLINRIFEALGIDIQLSNPTDLRRLSDAIKTAFETGDVTAIEKTVGRSIHKEHQGGIEMSFGDMTKEILRDVDAFNKWVADNVAAFPDITADELVEAIAEDIPGAAATEAQREALRERINKVLKSIKRKAKAEEKKIPKAEGVETKEDADRMVGIKHASTAEVRERYHLPEYERQGKTAAEVDAEADELIEDGVNIDSIIEKMKKGIVPSPAEINVVGRYIALLDQKLSDEPSNENLQNLLNVLKASDVIGTLQSQQFAARKTMKRADGSLAAFLTRQAEESEVDKLTEEQYRQNTKEFEEIKAANDALNKKIAELEAKLLEKEAKDNVNAAKQNKKKGERKTSDDFKKDRQSIIDSIKRKLAKARGEMNVTPVPYANELIAIAPDVAKLMASYVEQGIIELADIVSKVYADLKPAVNELTEKDVRDIIGGKYSEPKKTRRETAVRLAQLKTEAKLLTQIEELEAGKEPSSELKKQERNQKLYELRQKIKSYPLQQLADAKKRIKSEIAKLEEQLASNDPNVFAEKEKKVIVLDEEAKNLKRELVSLQTRREIRLMKDRYNKRSDTEKIKDKIIEGFNVAKSLKASIDFSAPFRQAVVATISHPVYALNAAKAMFKATASQDYFDEWFYDIQNDPRYELIQEVKLGLADPHSPFLVAKEEAFMSGYVEKIEQFIGRKVFNSRGFGLVQSSERAYVMYLNKMRWDLYMRFVDRFESKQKFYENEPELYKKAAEYVNNITGRGSLGKLEAHAPLLNVAIWSPRLVFSRINLLLKYPFTLHKLPKEIRNEYLKDMGLFMAAGATVVGAYALYGATMSDDDDDKITVEFDPRSPDFMKIKQRNTRFDVFGGFQPYVRFLAQFYTGEKKSSRTDEIVELAGDAAFGEDRGDISLRFLRTKLSPIMGSAVNLITGRNMIGEETSVKNELLESVTPLSISGMVDAYKDLGAVAFGTAVASSTFGIGVQTYNKKPIEVTGKLRYEGVTIKLSDELKDKFEKSVNAETDRLVGELKKLPQYKAATTKKERADMETIAKDAALSIAKNKFIKQNKTYLKQEAKKIPKKDTKTKDDILKKLK